jgi:hypothetical protein
VYLNAVFGDEKLMMEMLADVPPGGLTKDQWKERIIKYGHCESRRSKLNMTCLDLMADASGWDREAVSELAHQFGEYNPTGTLDAHQFEGPPRWMDELVAITIKRLVAERRRWVKASASSGPYVDARHVEQSRAIKAGPNPVDSAIARQDDDDMGPSSPGASRPPPKSKHPYTGEWNEEEHDGWFKAKAWLIHQGGCDNVLRKLCDEMDENIAWYIPPWLGTLICFGAGYVGAKAAIWCLSRIFCFREQSGNTQAIALRNEKNVVPIHANSLGVIGFGMVITNRAIIYPQHFNRNYAKSGMSFQFDGVIYPLNGIVAEVEGQDLCMRVIDLPREVSGKTLKSFVTQQSLMQLLAQARTRKTARVSFINQHKREHSMDALLAAGRDNHQREYVFGGYNSESGDCGLPVYWDEGQAQASPTLGIHVGATSLLGSAGYFTVVTQELLLECMTQLKLPTASVPPVVKANEQPTVTPGARQKLDKIFDKPRTDLVSACANTRKVFNETNAEIFEQEVPAVRVERRMFAQAKDIPDTMCLANLRPEYRICAHGPDCRESACQVVPGDVHQEASDARTGLTDEAKAVAHVAAKHVADMFNEHVKQPFVPLLPAQVVGPTKLPYFTPYNYTSGQGLTLPEEKVNQEFIESKEYLDALADWMCDLYANPVVYPVKIFPKDEAITVKKYMQGRTRQIASHPPHVKISERCFKGEIINHIYNHQFDLSGGFANAFNPYTEGWKLRRWLVHDEWKYFDIDIKQQDATISSFMTGNWTKLVLSTYDPTHPLYPSLIAHMDIMHCSFNAFAAGYGKPLGCWRFDDISSGKYDTSVENTYCAILMAHTALAILSVRHGLKADALFEDMRVVASGDDVVVAMSPRIHTLIGAPEWINAYREMGMTATSGRKDAEIEYYNSLDECVFLKRTFDIVTDPTGNEVVSGKLAFKSIFKRFVFHKQRITHGEVTQLKNIAYYELSRHGRAVYNKHAHRIAKTFKRFSKGGGVIPSWEDAWNKAIEESLKERDQSQPFGTLFHHDTATVGPEEPESSHQPDE